MTFLWPKMLWWLALVPSLALAYRWLLARKRRSVSRYAGLALAAAPAGRWGRMRPHVGPALLLAAIAMAIVASARPRAVVTLPSQHRTIMLAIDVSLSMRATDVQPNRLTAAQSAAKDFIEQVPGNVRIGIVSFGGSASLVQKPTASRDELVEAIDRFQLQYGTATGSGLILSLATLFPEHDIDLEAIIYGSRAARMARDRDRQAQRDPRNGNGNASAPIGRSAPKTASGKDFKPVAPGSYTSAVIILLSDGRRTTGPDPLDAARMAADRGVRVYTVGFGTKEGGQIGGFEGYSAYVRLDEETLKAVADITHGEYFHAGTATDLRKVYQGLNAKLVLEKQETEIGALFSGVAAALAALAMVLSLLWYNRVV